jgi:hypothetical protein
MGADQQAGFMRADLTELAYTYAQPNYKRRKLNPSDLLLLGRTYGDAPCSRGWEEVLLLVRQDGYTWVGILPSP